MAIEKVVVPGRGPRNSDFVIVGEAPGAQEIKVRQPFVGPSGQVLNAALDQYVVGSYPEPYLTNVYKSRIMFDKDPAALTKLAMDCRPALLEELGTHKPKVILALGSVALQALTGNYGLKITKERGKLFPSDLSEHGIVAAVHPAYLLRGNGSFRQFKADVAYAIDLAAGGSPHEFVPPTWSVIQSKEELLDLFADLQQLPDGSQVAKDLETTGFSHRMDKILCGGWTSNGKHVYVYNGYKTDALKDGIGPNLVHELSPLWDMDNLRFNWHNGKFDIKFFHHIQQHGARVDDDTMLMSYALDETRGIHDLETVAGDWLASPNWKGVLDAHKKKKQSYDVIPWKILFQYMAYDIANTFRLKPILRERIRADKASERLYTYTLIPGSAYLTEVEKHGLFVDKKRVGENHEKKEAEALEYKTQMLAMADEISEGEFTDKLCNSPIQLATLIFDRLHLKSKGNVRSTSDDILQDLPNHPFVQLLRKYRKVHKALSTYVTPYYLSYADGGSVQDDGAVHTTYLLHGTATGRLASRDPNLQNIPRDPEVKGQFIAREGRIYIEVDLNQAELRSLACLSGDEKMCEAYTNPQGGGLHETTRLGMYDHKDNWSSGDIQAFKNKFWVPDEDPDGKLDPHSFIIKRILAEQKMKAKNVNFGIIYGITNVGLAEQTGEEPREAQRWLDAWAKQYPVAWDFINKCRMAPLRGQNLVTVFGHKKRFQIVTPETLIAIQNEAANMPHQSTASTITMHGGIRTYKWLKERDAYFGNTVHDSLLVDSPADPLVAYEIQAHLREVLQQVPVDWGLKRIPFLAETEMTLRWGVKHDPEDFYQEMGWDWAASKAAYEANQQVNHQVSYA